MNQDNESKHCQQVLRKNNLFPIKKLGKGGFGVVFLVSRANLKGYQTELFSVKCTNKKNFTKKPMLRKYLKQEIDVQSSIDQTNVVKLIRTFEDGGWNFMIMEYCDMGNLYTFQAQKHKRIFNISEAKKYMADILAGLHHLHLHNIIHRDLKPENILLTRDNHTGQIKAKICDFGFAKQTQDQVSTFCGTTYFMAPEIFAKKKYQETVDTWAAGVILFYMLFGVYPFKSLNMAAQIQSKCKEGFNFQLIKGIENQSLTKQDKKMLSSLFSQIFRIQPKERLSLNQFRKIMLTRDRNADKATKQSQQLSTIQTDQDQQILQSISQKIVFIQKVYQQIKGIGFLSFLEEVALKYYLDKYCLTLLLSVKSCNSNALMSKLKKELIENQQQDANTLLVNINKIQIPRLHELFSVVQGQSFKSYKQAYRIVLSHVFSKANKLIDDSNLKSQIKLKVFCCHSINRVFDQQYVPDIFVHFFTWNCKRMKSNEFKINDLSKWIQTETQQKINDTVRILCDKFYRKNK